MRRYTVVGLGRFGSWVARSLYEAGHEVLAFDRNAALVDEHAHVVTRAVVGDGGDVDVLRRAGVTGSHAAVVSTGEDLAASILAILALKDLKVDNIYAKVTNARSVQALERFGVAEMVFPEKEAAQRLARRITSTTVVDYMPMGDGYSLEQVAVPDAWVGRTLRELGLRRSHGIQVVGIHCLINSSWTVPPDPDHPLTESEVALVAGSDEALARLNRQLSGKG